MKRWKIPTVIVFILSVCLLSSYEAAGINSSVPRPRILDSRRPGQPPSRSAPTPLQSAPTGAGAGSAYARPSTMAPLDPNKVAAAVRAFPGLEQELVRVGRGSKTEVAEWRRLQDSMESTTAVDNRARLGREVQKQVAAELALLRKIAMEEGAKKTVAAIDGVLLYRQSRLDKLNKQLMEDRRDARTSATSTRTRRGSSPTGTGTQENDTGTTTTRRRR